MSEELKVILDSSLPEFAESVKGQDKGTLKDLVKVLTLEYSKVELIYKACTEEVNKHKPTKRKLKLIQDMALLLQTIEDKVAVCKELLRAEN